MLRPSAAVTLATLAVACTRAGYPPSAPSPLLARPLPQIAHRQTLDGRPFNTAELVGKPILVKFFATYCKPCEETLPAAERVHQAHPEVAFIGIDEDESPDAARDFVLRLGLTFPVVHDDSNVLSGRFRVSSMPMTFVADAAGVIRWVGAAGQTEDDLLRAVEAAR